MRKCAVTSGRSSELQQLRFKFARATYARRLAIVEPVSGNLRSNKRLDRFTYRGQAKVTVQWRLYCLVHNIEKVAHLSRKYGPQRAQ